MTTYIKRHFIILKEDFHHQDSLPHSFSCEERIPNIQAYRLLCERVGGAFRWDLRPQYLDDQILTMKLEDPATRLFVFYKESEIIGYSLIVKPSADNQCELTDNTIEIDNFGFFPEHTGRGYGRWFLQHLFKILFENHDSVYLSTRSTNHPKVPKFYSEQGMRQIGEEILPDETLLETTHPKIIPSSTP